MLSTRASTRLCSPKHAAQLGRAALLPLYHTQSSILGYPAGLRVAAIHLSQHGHGQSPRSFSTTTANHLRDFFPAKETEFIRQTPPAWPHHGYTEEEMLAVVPAHREPKTFGDWVAWKLIRLCRWGMDFVTGLEPEQQQTDMKNSTTATHASKPLTEAQWLVRFIFLESIAGVPGMVAGMLRHLHSLRRLRRDNGWIETLLEESYNERMHLLTFMKMCEPGPLMKFLILGAQGVFFNAMFATYLVAPRVCHRFVGYLEEEAVHTYTRCIREMEAGLLPRWTSDEFRIPDMAVAYWRMPEGRRTMRDLVLYIRADEATHRGVNHTLGNLNQKEDPNPFVSDYKAGSSARKPVAALKPEGYERDEVIG